MSESDKLDPAKSPQDERKTVLVMNGAGMIIDWSQTAEAIFGWTSADAIGRRLSELIIPEKLRPLHEAGLKRFSGGPSALMNRPLEINALDRAGNEVPVELYITPVETADGFRFATAVRKL
jgi:PAS domain S-box-containing protein